MCISKFTLICALSLLAGPVLADEARLRDLAGEQSTAAQAGMLQPGSLQVSHSSDRFAPRHRPHGWLPSKTPAGIRATEGGGDTGRR